MINHNPTEAEAEDTLSLEYADYALCLIKGKDTQELLASALRELLHVKGWVTNKPGHKDVTRRIEHIACYLHHIRQEEQQPPIAEAQETEVEAEKGGEQ